MMPPSPPETSSLPETNLRALKGLFISRFPCKTRGCWKTNNHLGLSAALLSVAGNGDEMLLHALNAEGSEKFDPWDCQDASFEVIYKEQHRLVGRALPLIVKG